MAEYNVIDSVNLTRPRARELLARMDTVARLTNPSPQPGFAKAQHDLLVWLEDAVPMLRGHSYGIDVRSPLYPRVDIFDKPVAPEDDDVLERHEIPRDNVYEFLEKFEASVLGGNIQRFELWEYLERLFQINAHQRWTVSALKWYGIYLKAGSFTIPTKVTTPDPGEA